jgi:uncharacterized protein
MELTVLGASGAVGREIVAEALERGHVVTAIARHIDLLPGHVNIRRVAADVLDTTSFQAAIEGATTILSGLGISKGEKSGVLTAGARSTVDLRPERIIWLGAYGTGRSAVAAGALTRGLLRIGMRSELGDKVTADATVLDAGGVE